MVYHIFKPPESLKDLIRFYWAFETDASELKPYIHPATAAGSAKLAFHYEGRFKVIRPSGCKQLFASGFQGPAGKSENFVGMSLGGLITQIAALKNPDRVKSLSLISTGPFGPSDPDIPAMDDRIYSFHERGKEVDWSDEDDVTNYMLEGAVLMSGSRRLYDQSRGEALIRAEFRRANQYESMFNHAALQGGEQYFGRVNQIEQPALIIHGMDDKIWNYRHTETLLNELSNSRLVSLEGAGHEIHYQDWDTIIQSISNHISASEDYT